MKSLHAASSFHLASRSATRLLTGLLVLCALPGHSIAQIDGMAGYSQQNRNQNQQAIDPSQQVVEHFHGVVVNSIDKRPIARALVSTGDQRMAAMTDSEGRFSFDVRRATNASTSNSAGFNTLSWNGGRPLQDMAVFLTVRRPGYLNLNSSVSFGSRNPNEEVRLQLVPEGIVHGHVSVSDGVQPPGTNVQLYLQQVQDGASFWAHAGGAQTNGHGDYRFADLAAGDYKVMASSVAGGLDTPATSEQSFGYAPAYYGGASSLASTPSLHLSAGENAVADLNLRAATLYHVTVPVSNASKGGGMSAIVGNPGEQSGLFLRFNAQTQMLDGYLPNGAYDIRVTSNGPQQASSTGRGRIEVAGKAVKAPPITLVPSMQIPVLVHQQYTAQPYDANSSPGSLEFNLSKLGPHRSLDITLRPLAPGTPAAGLKNVPNQSDDNLVLDNVQEGAYRVTARPFRGYVAAMSVAGVDLLRQPLVIGPGGAGGPIDITLRDDSATLSGTVTLPNPLPTSSSSTIGDSLGPGNYLIICIPIGNAFATPPLQATAFNAGKFTLSNLAPGDYLILASNTSMLNIEYQNPDVLRQYQLKGTTVTLSPNQKAQIQVPVLTGPEGEN